jgi:hypothetical protein
MCPSCIYEPIDLNAAKRSRVRRFWLSFHFIPLFNLIYCGRCLVHVLFSMDNITSARVVCWWSGETRELKYIKCANEPIIKKVSRKIYLAAPDASLTVHAMINTILTAVYWMPSRANELPMSFKSKQKSWRRRISAVEIKWRKQNYLTRCPLIKWY